MSKTVQLPINEKKIKKMKKNALELWTSRLKRNLTLNIRQNYAKVFLTPDFVFMAINADVPGTARAVLMAWLMFPVTVAVRLPPMLPLPRMRARLATTVTLLPPPLVSDTAPVRAFA